MGRRKSTRKPPQKRKRVPVDKVFNCPFCQHEKSCEVTIDYKHKVGYIECDVCKEHFKTEEVNYLYAPIDVYNDWIDACDSVNPRA